MSKGDDAPLFDLYSMIVDGGKLRTFRIVSLPDRSNKRCEFKYVMQHTLNHVPNFLPNLNIPIDPVPQTDNVFALSHTDGTPTNLRPIRPRPPTVAPILPTPGIIARSLLYNPTFIELIPNNSKDEILPNPIRNALLQADDPFPAREVEWILPNRSTDT